jgi:hypothetical protein
MIMGTAGLRQGGDIDQQAPSIGVAPFMVTPNEERAAQIKTLHGLLDRLCSPDITLEEAKVLRSQLLDLLQRINPLLSEASTPSRHRDDPSAGNPKKTG